MWLRACSGLRALVTPLPRPYAQHTPTTVDRKTCTKMQNNNSFFPFFLLFLRPSTSLQMINTLRIVVWRSFNCMCGDADCSIQLHVNLYELRKAWGVEINVWTVSGSDVSFTFPDANSGYSSEFISLAHAQCSLSLFRPCYSFRFVPMNGWTPTTLKS